MSPADFDLFKASLRRAITDREGQAGLGLLAPFLASETMTESLARIGESFGVRLGMSAPEVSERPAELRASEPARQAPAGRRARGIAPEVRRAMPDRAHRLYEWAEARADRRGRFTCTRPQAMRTLLASDGSIGAAIRLHIAAGTWRREKPGGWRARGRQRPRQTVYAFVDDFDREHAIRTYREHRDLNRARLERLRQEREMKRSDHTLPVHRSTLPVTLPVPTGSVAAVSTK